ncbi:MAG: sigma-70 family RNA polymerase sigma factor [Anaerolineae bacterium]|nr:sigma-70 family RNA polymerase sigma factor [Anaerolineae bacterium]
MTVPTTNAAPDDAPLALIAQTESSAFGELYVRHAARVYRYIYVRVGGAALAEDLTAETFLAAYTSLNAYDEQGRFAGWLLGIARNVVADHFRAHKADLPLDALSEQPRDSASPEEAASLNLELERLRHAMRDLTDEQAEVIRLRMFAELDTSETARLMGKSEAAVKMLLHRALRALRQQMQRQEETR